MSCILLFTNQILRKDQSILTAFSEVADHIQWQSKLGIRSESNAGNNLLHGSYYSIFDQHRCCGSFRKNINK
jgi:hypothetical protein